MFRRNTDERLRKLEKQALTGDIEARARAFKEKLRSGQIDPYRLRVLSHQGDPAARLLFPDPEVSWFMVMWPDSGIYDHYLCHQCQEGVFAKEKKVVTWAVRPGDQCRHCQREVEGVTLCHCGVEVQYASRRADEWSVCDSCFDDYLDDRIADLERKLEKHIDDGLWYTRGRRRWLERELSSLIRQRDSQRERRRNPDDEIERLLRQAKKGDIHDQARALNAMIRAGRIDEEDVLLAKEFGHPLAAFYYRPADPQQQLWEDSRIQLEFGPDSQPEKIAFRARFIQNEDLRRELVQTWIQSLRQMHQRLMDRARLFGLQPQPEMHLGEFDYLQERLDENQFAYAEFDRLRGLVSDLWTAMNQLVISPKHDPKQQFRDLLLNDLYRLVLPDFS
jgi:hypothetical protein